MIKGKGDDMGWAKDMGVIGQKKKKTRKKNPRRIMQNMKMNKSKKKAYKRIALLSAHRRRNDQP
jgi:hypothetical protein